MIRRRSAAGLVFASASTILAAASCAQIIGLDQYTDGVCNPGTKRACYAGPAGTEGVGICRAGTQVCKSDGQAWESCTGSVVPSASEDCTNNVDDDCNGIVNDTCTCIAGTIEPCYSGAAATEGKGICHGGMHTCNADGTGYSACEGEQTPLPEDCSTKLDENCDGQVNEASAGCVCIPGETLPCYTGDPQTEGKGICHGGVETCNDDGLGFGSCVGEQAPLAEDCSTPLDDNCDGQVNEAAASCHCIPGETTPCYTGPGGTEAVGLCAGGTQVCDPDGLGYGACVGEVTPVAEDCNNATDEDCDGFACSRTIWAKQFGSGGSPIANRVAVNPATGEIYIAGSFSGAIQFGTNALVGLGISDAFLAKLDTNGTPLWAKRFGNSLGTSTVTIRAMGVDVAGNVTMISQGDLGGGTNVMKVGPTGTPIWSKACGTVSNTSTSIYDVAVDPQGDAIIVGLNGLVCAGASLSTSGGKLMFAKLSGIDGTPLWIKQFGGPSTKHAQNVTTDGNGNIYVAGTTTESLTFGNPFPSMTYNGNGSTNDIFVVRLAPSGTPNLAFGLGGAYADDVSSLAVDALGSIYLSGVYQGTLTLPMSTSTLTGPTNAYREFIAKLDATAHGVWLKDARTVRGLALDSAANVLAMSMLYSSQNIGGITLASAGAADSAVLKFNGSTGVPHWGRVFGDATHDQKPTWITAGNFNEVLIAGTFGGTMSFDNTTLTVAGTNTAIFLAKIAP